MMGTGGVMNLLRAFSPARLTGPILDKELRVSSRRRRNYVLRAAYLLLLLVFVVLVWISEVDRAGGYGGAGRVARMAEAGKTVIAVIAWFQFCVLQLLAVVMLSTSVSEEIYARTLPALMSTPISSFQIVGGKLLSKLLQILILLGISLPLLAVVRVFGGVPWDFVVAGLCLTLSAVLFNAALSMYFSISSRRAYAVILKTFIALGIIFALVPMMIVLVLGRSMTEAQLLPRLAHANPTIAMAMATEAMMSPWSRMSRLGFRWEVCCLVLLGATALLLLECTRKVRRTALREAGGDVAPSGLFRRRRPGTATGAIPPRAAAVRRIAGPPVLWKELRKPALRGWLGGWGGKVLAVGLLVATYVICAVNEGLDDRDVQIVYVLALTGLGILTTVILAATPVTLEKEARSWPILLATPLGEWAILLGKAGGIVRRCLPNWGLLAGHVVLFTLIGYLHPTVGFHLTIVFAWAMVFLIGTGLYFGTAFRRTTTAVAMNLGLAIALWVVLPILLVLVGEISRDRDVWLWCVDGNPGFQAIVIAEGASGRHDSRVALGQLDYDWATRGASSWGRTTTRLAAWGAAYMAAGAFCAWRAKCRLRRSAE